MHLAQKAQMRPLPNLVQKEIEDKTAETAGQLAKYMLVQSGISGICNFQRFLLTSHIRL